MPRQVKYFGWIPDLPDARDLQYSAPQTARIALPPLVDLRTNCPPVYDQGELGSCTAQAIAAAFQYEQLKQGIPNFIPSRLFIYYNERVALGTVEEDSGAMLRDGIKSAAKDGVCPEDPFWPYDINKFAIKPPEEAYTEALNHQVVRYLRISRDINQLKSCLASSYPFTIGFTVYSSMGDHSGGSDGYIPVPKADEEIIGGHAVLVVGYDDEKQCWIFRNSWGTEWGEGGYGYLPYIYTSQSNMSRDFWTIRFVESGAV